jgi:hypothetical protein
MGLLNLPLEIIDDILDLTLPAGIEGFVLSCKTVYRRAAPQLRRHKELKQRWRCTSNHESERIDDTLRIIYDISREPLVAEYIEVLDLWDDRSRGDGHYWEEFAEEQAALENFRSDEQALMAIKSLISKSLRSCGSNVAINDLWEHMMKEELQPEDDYFKESSCTVVGLLSLLPNIKTLRLPGWWEGAEKEAGNTLEILVDAANRDDAQGKPLSKLRTILPFLHDGYDERTGLQSLLPLLSLRTLKETYLVSAVAVDDNYTGLPFHWSPNGLNSSLTRLEFVACCMDADGLSELIAHTPALTIFKYSHETKWHGCEHDWNPGSFAEALGRHCGNTLTEVAITLDEVYGDIINGASSFHLLPRLEKLEVDVKVFCGPPLESGQRLGQDAFVPRGEVPWTQNDIPCIGSMLPDSIVEADINITDPIADTEALRALLKNLKEQRAERLFKLERVVVRQYGNDSMMEMSVRAGATLEAFDLDIEEAEMRLPVHMPKWYVTSAC